MMIQCLVVAILHQREGGREGGRERERKRERDGRGNNPSSLWLMRERNRENERKERR